MVDPDSLNPYREIRKEGTGWHEVERVIVSFDRDNTTGIHS
jgi:hypothetical protein